MTIPQTAQTILDQAQALCQSRGFNGFSYGDIADTLGIKKASIHYHYPSKVDLGIALVERYGKRLAAELANIEIQHQEPKKQLREFVKIMELLKQNGRLCLCAMLATDFETLDSRLHDPVRNFFAMTESWIEARLKSGKNLGEFHFVQPAKVVAQAFLSSIQGMLICDRTFGDQKRFESGKEWLFASIESRADKKV